MGTSQEKEELENNIEVIKRLKSVRTFLLELRETLD
jgi:hypothetical protein